LGGSAGRDIGLYFFIWRPKDPPMDAFKLILVSLAGWMNRQQQHVIEYLQEEIRVLKERQPSRLSLAFPCAFRPPEGANTGQRIALFCGRYRNRREATKCNGRHNYRRVA
jgi:hypothetical protein